MYHSRQLYVLSFNMNYHKLDSNFIKNFSVFLWVPWHFFWLPYTPRMCFYFFIPKRSGFLFSLLYRHLGLQILITRSSGFLIPMPWISAFVMPLKRIENPDTQCWRISNPSELRRTANCAAVMTLMNNYMAIICLSFNMNYHKSLMN